MDILVNGLEMAISSKSCIAMSAMIGDNAESIEVPKTCL